MKTKKATKTRNCVRCGERFATDSASRWNCDKCKAERAARKTHFVPRKGLLSYYHQT